MAAAPRLAPSERRERIVAALGAIRRRRRIAWLLLPAFLLMAVFPRAWFPVLVVLWIVAVLVTSLRAGYARCPRCDRFFFMKWFYSNGFSSKCLNCGLRLDASNLHDDLESPLGPRVRVSPRAKVAVRIALFAVCYGLFASIVIPDWRDLRDFERDGASTTARVTATESSNLGSIRYTFDVDGREFSGSGRIDRADPAIPEAPAVGETIAVTYLPASPARSLPGRPTQRYAAATGILFMVLPVFCLFVALLTGGVVAETLADLWLRVRPSAH